MNGLIVFVLVLCLATNIGGSYQSPNGNKVSNTLGGSQPYEYSKEPLLLTTQPIKEAYCDGPDPDLASLRMVLLLRFTNTSRQKVVLKRNDYQVRRISVSKTPEDMALGRSEYTGEPYTILSNESVKMLRGEPHRGRRVTVMPGTSYETPVDVFVLVPRAKIISGSLEPGKHYLQLVVVSTWDGEEEPKNLRGKRGGARMAWSETVSSEPMLFVVKPNPKLDADCECRESGINETEATAIAKRDSLAGHRSAFEDGVIAFKNSCEWHIVFMTNNGKPRARELMYLIDATTGSILYKGDR